MKTFLKTFLMTAISLILIAVIGLGTTYAVKPDLVKDWFNIENSETNEDDEQEAKVLDFNFSTNGMVTGYLGTDTDVVIPSTYSEVRTLVGTFESAEELEVYLDTDVERDFNYVLTENDGTVTTYIPFDPFDSMEEFSFPAKLESVEYIEGDDYTVTGLGYAVFSEYNFNTTADQITSVTVPNTITYIFNDFFRDCTNLTCVDLSNCTNLTSIGKNAFNNCTSLETLILPATVTEIGSGVFYLCENLTAIYVPADTVESYKTLLPDYADIIVSIDELN